MDKLCINWLINQWRGFVDNLFKEAVLRVKQEMFYEGCDHPNLSAE